MLKALRLLICFCVTRQSRAFDYKLITSVRHGIDINLEYIDRNFEKMNEDCWFGVVLATAIIKDAYQNGTHVMDNSSLKLLKMSLGVLKKGISSDRTWTKYILDPSIWDRSIKYKYNALDPLKKRPNLKVLKNIYRYQNLSGEYPDSDFCLQNIVNLTTSLTPIKCYINIDCWKKYEYDGRASAYLLTHKLLLLQLARARKCLISDERYEVETSKICSLVLAEVISADYFDVLDDMFDLFLEEVVLCGYEGYVDFFKSKWLIYILKSQKQSGCFSGFLGDPLKSRIKRDSNVLADGCTDHTTGLGAAVLSLYYNFLIKGNITLIN